MGLSPVVSCGDTGKGPNHTARMPHVALLQYASRLVPRDKGRTASQMAKREELLAGTGQPAGMRTGCISNSKAGRRVRAELETLRRDATRDDAPVMVATTPPAGGPGVIRQFALDSVAV